MSVTLLNLKRAIGKELGFVTGAPSGAGTTTTLVDTSGDSPLDSSDDADLFDGAWLYIAADSAAIPQNVGELRRISTYAPSTGTLTVSRAFTNATTTTMTYEIYFGAPPERAGTHKGIKDYINDVLRLMFYRTRHLLTLVTDGDMETSGVTGWTASNATRTKSTSTGVIEGDQALRVLNSAANGYVYSGTIDVAEQRSYLLAADATVVSGTAELVAYDVTNSAEIESVTTDDRDGRCLFMSFTTPSDCKQVRIHLKGQEATADVYWDNVSLLAAATSLADLPSWFLNAEWLEEVEMRYCGGGSYNSAPLRYRNDAPMRWFSVVEDYTGVTPFRLRFDPPISLGSHLFIRAVRPYTELSADSDATDADQDWVRACVLARVYADRASSGPPSLDGVTQLQYWSNEAKALSRSWQPTVKRRAYMMDCAF